MFRLPKHRLAVATLVACGIPVVIGCTHSDTASSVPKPNNSTAAVTSAASLVARVTVVSPLKKRLIRTVEQPGTIEPIEQTPIHAKVTGYVSKVHVDLGDRVKTGDVLLEIAIPEYEQELKQKQALVTQSKAETSQADARVKVAEAAVRSAEALVVEAKAGLERSTAELERADTELSRLELLFADQAITEKVLEESKAGQRAAAAAVAEAQARIASSEAVVEEKRAGIEQAQADVQAASSRTDVALADEARLRAIHDYTKLTSPFDGIVTMRNADTGHFVQPGKGASDKPLVHLSRTDVVRVYVEVPEIDASLISNECDAVIQIPALGSKIEGKVSRSSWQLHPSTRTLRAAIDLPNADSKLRPGLYVLAVLTVADKSDALVIPKSSLVMKEGKPGVYVVGPKSTLVWQSITPGINSGAEIEVLAGLTGSESLIPTNVSAYREGQVVEIISQPSR